MFNLFFNLFYSPIILDVFFEHKMKRLADACSFDSFHDKSSLSGLRYISYLLYNYNIILINGS